MKIKRLFYKIKLFALCGFSLKKYRKFLAFEKKSKELYEKFFLDNFPVSPLDFNAPTEEIEVKSNDLFVKAEGTV